MVDEAPFRQAGTADHANVAAMADTIKSVIAATIPDPRDQAAVGMTACTLVAGYLYGMMIAIGVESGSTTRTKRAAKMVDTNFRSGIRYAMKVAAQSAATEGVN